MSIFQITKKQRQLLSPNYVCMYVYVCARIYIKTRIFFKKAQNKKHILYDSNSITGKEYTHISMGEGVGDWKETYETLTLVNFRW